MFSLRKSVLWLTDRMAGTYIALAFLLVGGSLLAHAATSYDVANLPDMFLYNGISASQTTNIRIAAPIINGSVITFPTTTGGILEIRQGTRVEHIYYASASVGSVTKIVTLSGTNLIRNVCFNVARVIRSCGNGQVFSKGASVRLVDAAQLFNLKANIDRSNTFTASGGVAFSGSGYSILPRFSSMGEADRQMGTVSNGVMYYNTGSGAVFQKVGGSWTTVGTSTTVNAAEGVAGKVELPTLAFMQALTATGSSGAQNAVPLKWLVKNGSGSTTAGRVPSLNSAGAVSTTLGGTGLASPTQSGVLVGNGAKAMNTVATSSSGAWLRTNANGSWFATTARVVSDKDVKTNTERVQCANGETAFTLTTTLPATVFNTGSTIEVIMSASGASTGGNQRPRLKIGSTVLCTGNVIVSGTNSAWLMHAYITTRKLGTSGQIRVDCPYNNSASGGSTGSTITLNTNTAPVFTPAIVADGTTCFSTLQQFIVR